MAPVKTIIEITKDNLVIEAPQEQKIEKTKGKKKEVIRYYTSTYAYQDDDDVHQFYIELPITTCEGGVLERAEENGRTSFSVKLKFDCQDTDIEKRETERFLTSMDNLWERTVEHVYKNKTKFKLDPSLDETQVRPLVKKPMYYRLDANGERLGFPSNYYKLGVYDNGRTPFFDLNNNVIDWSLLHEVKFKCKAIVRVRHLYTSKQSSVQMSVKQVTIVGPVTGIAQFNSMSSYTAEFREKYQESYQQQIESLQALKTKYANAPPKKNDNEDDEDNDIMN